MKGALPTPGAAAAGWSPRTLLRLDCSPQGEASTSRHMGEVLLAALQQAEPAWCCRQRDLARPLLPPVQVLQPPATVPAAAQAPGAELLAELQQSDRLLITAPVHNYTVPVALKLWIDHLLRPGVGFRHTATGKRGVLRDRPTWVAVSAGGPIFSAAAAQPDFFRPYLSAALATVGITDLHFITFERSAEPSDARDAAGRAALRWFERHHQKAST